MNVVSVGDLVELSSIPDAVIRDKDRFSETFDLFQRALQKRSHIRSINEYGFVELWLHDDGSEDSIGADHSIWVESENLRKIVEISHSKN